MHVKSPKESNHIPNHRSNTLGSAFKQENIRRNRATELNSSFKELKNKPNLRVQSSNLMASFAFVRICNSCSKHSHQVRNNEFVKFNFRKHCAHTKAAELSL